VTYSFNSSRQQRNNGADTMTTATNNETIEVTGRNGYTYDAVCITGNLFVVGKFIVTVEDGKVQDNVAKLRVVSRDKVANTFELAQYASIALVAACRIPNVIVETEKGHDVITGEGKVVRFTRK
jgi:hypothetical protein